MLQILKLSRIFKFAVKTFTPEDIQNIFSSRNSSEDDIYEILEYFENLHHSIFKNFGNLKSIQQIQQKLLSFNELKEKIKSYGFLLNTWKIFGDIDKKLIGPMMDVFNAYRSLKDYSELLDRKFKEIIFRHNYGGNIYIRFGKFPKSERSKMGLGREWEDELGGKTHEEGVSVYKAIPHNNKWMLIQPNSEKALYGNAGFTIQRFKYAILSGDIYLVTGNELPTTGADGEILIEDIFPIKKLSLDEIVLSNGESIQDFLEAGKEGYDFRAFQIKDEDKRKLAVLFQSFLNDSESSDLCDAMHLSDDENDWIMEIADRTNSGMNLQNLSQTDFDKLKKLLNSYLKIRNKSLVFKGYRPFY